MQIESICVTNHICGGFEQVSMGRNAETKSLPFLSVVQSTHGSYCIALDDGPALETGEMGVFVAPRARMQHLLHIPDERDGTMSAQWIFLDVEVNRRYRLDDLFLFPTVLPEKYHQDIYVLLRRIAATERLTDRLPDIHRLLCILLEVPVWYSARLTIFARLSRRGSSKILSAVKLLWSVIMSCSIVSVPVSLTVRLFLSR